jgi:hypothetical protein
MLLEKIENKGIQSIARDQGFAANRFVGVADEMSLTQ